jgi:hypothetical protein
MSRVVPGRLVHGEATPPRTPEYRAWRSMKARCHIPSSSGFANYGGRGIYVCDRWRHDYEAFLVDVGRKPSADHSLDRVDNDGPYAPGNVRWATRSEQGQNRRTNALVTAFGRTQCIEAWAAETGLKDCTIWRRLWRGWDPERALSQPSRRRCAG